jgi:hypothetical protein
MNYELTVFGIRCVTKYAIKFCLLFSFIYSIYDNIYQHHTFQTIMFINGVMYNLNIKTDTYTLLITNNPTLGGNILPNHLVPYILTLARRSLTFVRYCLALGPNSLSCVLYWLILVPYSLAVVIYCLTVVPTSFGPFSVLFELNPFKG